MNKKKLLYYRIYCAQNHYLAQIRANREALSTFVMSMAEYGCSECSSTQFEVRKVVEESESIYYRDELQRLVEEEKNK